jgi:2'-5' RNA ligase
MLEAEEKELLGKVERTIKGYRPIDVEVMGTNVSNTASQCVFAQIKMSAQLLALYNELAAQLRYSDKSPFFPHLSLVYGEISPEEKSEIASQVKLDNRLQLDKLVIYRDGPSSDDWAHVAEFSLNA